MSDSSIQSAFKASRLTPSTFLIIEHSDSYDEHPYIYAKIIPTANTILIVDTGCGGATNNPKINLKSLRRFIEVVGVHDNARKPLNEGGSMGYAVVLSHCHYDHILGVEQFAIDSPIFVSSHSLDFISPANLPIHSLCQDFGIQTPQYTTTPISHRQEIQITRHHPRSSNDKGGSIDTKIAESAVSTGVVALHTPGHTPDELALWDEDEGMLYVGDTLYEWAHIIFPTEGSVVEWFQSVEMLIDLIHASTQKGSAKINCGHTTASRPALEVLQGARDFMMDVLSRREGVRDRFEKRGEVFEVYAQEGMRYSLACPKRLIDDAREKQRSSGSGAGKL